MGRSPKFLALATITILVPTVFIWYMLARGMDTVDLVLQIMFVCIFLPLIIMGEYMWTTGKGAAWINTSSPAQRDLYDPGALAKFAGMFMTISLTLMLLAIGSRILSDSALPFWILLIAGIAVLIAGTAYIETGGRLLRKGANAKEFSRLAAEGKKINKDVLIGMGVLMGIIAVMVVIIMLLVAPAGSVDASLEDDGLHIEAPRANRVIAYGEITSVEIRETFDTGRRVGGFGGTEIRSGNFQNDEFGRYVLASYNSVPGHIVVHYSGGVLAFNLDSQEKTVQMFNDLQAVRAGLED